MKAIPCTLVCWNFAGYRCFHGEFQTLRKALNFAREMLTNDLAFSYRIYRKG